MSLGDAWTETTPGSASKLNLTNVIFGTGAYLATLNKTKHKIVVCTSTGSGFTVDHVYLFDASGTTAIDLSDINEHTHTDSTTGGTFENLLRSNSDVADTALLGFINLSAGSTGMYREAVTGTGSHSTQTDGTTNERYIQASTGATNGSTTSIHMPINLNVNFAKGSFFGLKHKINTATSLALKTGFGMESLAGADNNNRKYGAEICTTVNTNWFAASANGTTRSSSDTGTAMTTNKKFVGCYLFEDVPKIDLFVEGQSAFTKTSNIPTSASANQPDRGALFRYSTKNNTGSDRTFNFYGTRLVYVIEDDSGYS